MDSLGSNREKAQNKIILLYMIDTLGIPVSNLQITKLILEKKFMNYFLLQQFLNELQDSGFLLTEVVDGKTMYMITPSGKQALEYFSSHIPPGIKDSIRNSLAAVKTNIKNETRITSDFVPESENKFVVSCKVREDDFSLMEIMIATGTKSDARLICINWKKHTQQIYSEIIEILTKKRD